MSGPKSRLQRLQVDVQNEQRQKIDRLRRVNVELLEAAIDALSVLNQIKHDRDDLPRLETTARFARRGLEAAIKHAQDRE